MVAMNSLEESWRRKAEPRRPQQSRKRTARSRRQERSAVNRYLLTPNRNVTGKNTTTVTKVMAKNRQSHFVGSLLGRHSAALPIFKMAEDIFQHDDGVVDQP